MKPFLKWAGGKTQLLPEIRNRFIKSKKYCEPFIGGGAVLFDLLENNEFDDIYISDVNRELCYTYITVRENVEELIKVLTEIEKEYLNSSDRIKYYYDKRDEFNSFVMSKCEVMTAADFIFLNRTCFNGLYRVNSKGLFNVPIGRYKNPSIIPNIENLMEVSKSLRKVHILNSSFEESYNFIDKDTFVYIDPPYRPISPSSFNSYAKSLFNDKTQVRLKEFVDSINDKGAKFLISNSDTKDGFFDELYRNYRIERVQASRFINSKSNGRGEINELLISNGKDFKK